MSKTTQQNTAKSGADLNAEQGTQEQSTPSTQTQGTQTSQSTEQSSIASKISPLPTPPSSNDSGSFVERADKFFMALPKFADELNAFGQKVDTSINEKIESTAKLTKDELFKHSEQAINSKMQNIKDELVLQVAQETNELVRKSYRLLELNTITNKDSLPFQLVWRANEDGNTALVKGNFKRTNAFELLVDENELDFVMSELTNLRGEACVFIIADNFECLMNFAFLKNHEILLSKPPKSVVSIEIEGLV